MTILELCFNIDRAENYESYDKNFDYWTVDDSGKFLFLTYKDSLDNFKKTEHRSKKRCRCIYSLYLGQ